MQKLLDCPFCGGRPGFREAEKMEVGFGFSDWYVGCRCGASGPTGGPFAEGKKLAAELWNKRKDHDTDGTDRGG